MLKRVMQTHKPAHLAYDTLCATALCILLVSSEKDIILDAIVVGQQEVDYARTLHPAVSVISLLLVFPCSTVRHSVAGQRMSAIVSIAA